MVKVLIIDDEEPVREAIRILGDWQGLGVDELLEAADGRRGLELLERHKPDLVLVDMKMPELDGLQFLQQVEKDYPELFTIVISGYNDFDYTRQAIRSRVVDYLLKPVNRHDLNAALRKAFDVLRARRESESEFIRRNITLNMSVPKLKENIYLSVIERNFQVKNNEAFLRLIGADDPAKRFGTSALRVLNLEGVSEEKFQKETELLKFAISNVLGEFSEEGFQSFGFANPKREREIVVVHTMSGGYLEDLTFRSVRFMKKVLGALKELFGVEAAAGIGLPGSDISQLADSYEQASSALGDIDLLRLGAASPAVALAETGGVGARAGSADSPSIASRIPLIRSAIDAGNANQARGIVLDYARKLAGQERFGLQEAARILDEFVILLGDLAHEYGVPPAKLAAGGAAGLKAVGIRSDYAGFAEYEALLGRVVDYYAQLIRSASAPDRAFDVSEIKDYIDQHYFEDIKISMFTDRYFLSREYLMKLFKQQYGSGIHEYVQKIRMDKAKELLGESDLKIQEISEMLGYKDKNYFSKAFRNYFSLSPTEYRTQRTDG